MSTFADYWLRLRNANDDLEDACKLTLTGKAFKEQLRKAYEQGAKDANEAMNANPFPWVSGSTV